MAEIVHHIVCRRDAPSTPLPSLHESLLKRKAGCRVWGFRVSVFGFWGLCSQLEKTESKTNLAQVAFGLRRNWAQVGLAQKEHGRLQHESDPEFSALAKIVRALGAQVQHDKHERVRRCCSSKSCECHQSLVTTVDARTFASGLCLVLCPCPCCICMADRSPAVVPFCPLIS